MRTYAVIDAPSDLGLKPTGTAGLPEALKEAGLLNGLVIRHETRLAVPPHDPQRNAATGIRNAQGIATFSRTLAQSVNGALDRDEMPIVLGGDCSVLLGPLIALRKRGRFGLLFLDGHADFYSPDAEPNGEVASMELAIATGRDPEALSNIDGLRPLVREDDVVAFGIRDTATAIEHGSPDVRETEIHVFELAEVRRLGLARAAAAALEPLTREGIDGFWIHLDADVLNDNVMRAVDYRMPDGLMPDELTAVLAAALASPRAVGLNVTIYNPRLDDESRTGGTTLAEVLNSVLEPFPRPSRQRGSTRSV